MSYILDALRRADSERERGGVPSLHAKQVPDVMSDDDDDEASPRSRQPLVWAVAGLSLALVAALAWQLMGSGSPEPVAAMPAAAAPVPPPPIAAPAPATAVAAAPAPAPVTPAPAPAPVAKTPAPSAPPPAAVPATPPRAAEPSVPRATARVAAKPATPPSVPAVDETPISAISDLPENVRRELPQLTVGGAMYSGNAASRMLILNGQVFREGEQITPDLKLVQIRLKSAVLAYKTYRYSINY